MKSGQDIDESFKSFHNAFVFIFLGELILRIGLRGKGFFMDIVPPEGDRGVTCVSEMSSSSSHGLHSVRIHNITI